ncbi:MAG: hypothetical protein WBN41_01430 [Lysobacterales bacterium]
MRSELPVVFLAFANQLDDHLATLKDESRDLFKTLQALERADKIAIHREESSEFDELYDSLLAYDDRVVIFHYGGHADGASLELEDGAGGASGIAGLLGKQSSLKLVFLNGCATKAQVKLLHAAGVPAVIATAVKINDKRATQFSTKFYAALVEGHGIFEAFDLARNYIEAKLGTGNSGATIHRSPVFQFEEEDTGPLEFEWALFVQKHATGDLEQWRLPESREDWRVQLVDSRGPIRGIDDKPLLTESRSRLRSIATMLCGQCGTKSSVSLNEKSFCPACGSDQQESLKTQATLPESVLYAKIDREQARSIFEEAVHDDEAEILQLELLYLPFWHFSLAARSNVKGERGSVKTFDTDDIKLTWDEIEEAIDIQFDSLLVSASDAPVNSASIASQEWNLDESSELLNLDQVESFVPMEQDIVTAFSSAAAVVDGEAKLEAQDLVGGLQQRNISTDTRYTKVDASSLYLPFWYAVANTPNGKISISINAISGVANNLRIPGMQHTKLKENSSMREHRSQNSSSTTNSTLVSIFSGVGIGIMVGLLMGLAAPAGEQAKTVVGIFIGAVGVGLAALLGLNDRHFSTAKGLRIGSFGLAVALSALSGIYVRDHGLMTPDLKERVDEVHAVFPSFKDDDMKTLQVLAAIDSGTGSGEPGTTPPPGSGIKLKSQMYSGVVQDDNVCDKLFYMSDSNATEYKALRSFRNNDEDGKLGWKTLADNAEKSLQGEEEDLLNFLLISRSALCGRWPYSKRVVIPATACAADAKLNTDEWLIAFKDNTESRKLLENIQGKLSAEAQPIALGLLGPALCPTKKEQ